MNRTEFIGNLTVDPTIREVRGTDGQPVKVCSFNVAVNMRYSGGREDTVYYRVSAWRNLAEICQTYLAKGRKVYCEGIVRASCYTNNQGQQVASLELNANNVEFLSRNEQNAQQNAAPAQPAVQPNYGVGVPADPNNGFQPVETDELPF